MNKIIIRDEKGTLKIYDNSNELRGIDIYFLSGDNNTVIIEEPYKIDNLKVLIAGNENEVEIAANSEIRKAVVWIEYSSESEKTTNRKTYFLRRR